MSWFFIDHHLSADDPRQLVRVHRLDVVGEQLELVKVNVSRHYFTSSLVPGANKLDRLSREC
jgi:hypothetical protein